MMTRKSRLAQVWSKVTVEPCTFMYVLATCLQKPTEQYFFYLKCCSERFPDSICHNLENVTNAEEEIVVQEDLAKLQFQAGMFDHIPPLFLTIFYGIISDRYSRKLTMIVPLVGRILECALYIAMSLRPDIPIYLYMLGKTFVGVTGNWQTFFMSMLSYIACITSESDRTSRLGIANSAWVVAYSIGYFFSGVIMDNTSFVFMFAFSLGWNALALLYLIIFVHEDRKGGNKVTNKIENAPKGNGQTEETVQLNDKTKEAEGGKKLKMQSNPAKYFFASIKLLLRKRSGNTRAYLLVIFSMMFFMIFGNFPFHSIIYLFTKKQPLSWSQTLFGYFLGICNVTRALGMLCLLPILKRFKVKDTYLLMAALASYVACGFMLGWAEDTWLVFFAGIIAFFGDNMYAIGRSIVSFYVEPNEVGQIFAVIGSIQGASEMAATAMYNLVYAESLTKLWAGFVFVLGACIFIVPLALTVWLHIDMRKRGMFKISDQKDMNPKIENIESQVINRKPCSTGSAKELDTGLLASKQDTEA